jgi:AhpD family alkylhydroperoxidase
VDGHLLKERVVGLRLEYWSIAPQEYRATCAVLLRLKEGLDPRLWHLVFLRVSQINGCAFCVDNHATQALQAGESARRLNALALWRDTPLFSDTERAALAWAERVTRLGDRGPSDEAFQSLRANFSDKQVVTLTLAIALINALNRLAIGFGRTPTLEQVS